MHLFIHRHGSDFCQKRKWCGVPFSQICERFPLFVRQLSRRARSRDPLIISDEDDVQYLLNCLLSLHFDDVRPEEGTPSTGGGAARIDFLLKDEQIVLEVKMTREGLEDKEVYDDLVKDAARYQGHPDCKVMFCLVYDPNRLIRNPRGLVKDLQALSGDQIQVQAFCVS